MKEVPLTLAEIGIINSTRFVIGTGVGLLLSDRMDRKTRKAVSISLLVAGVLFSIPIGWSFISKLRSAPPSSPQVSDARVA